jgi:hypothetical protein
MDIVAIILAATLYPGLITTLALGLIYRLLRGRAGGGSGAGGLGAALRSREGLAAIAGMLAAAVGLAAMPWPFHPLGATRAWLWAWAGIELAFLIPLAPALAAGAPQVVRAAARRAQIGAFGRALLWVALTASLTIHAEWRLAALPAHLLALTAAMIAFPIAAGWGPFDDEASVTGAGVGAGLPPAARWLDGLARDVATGALLAAALVATLPTASGPAWLGPILIAVGFAAAVATLRRLDGRMPRLTLPAILSLGWAYVAPLAAAAAVALIIAGSLT